METPGGKTRLQAVDADLDRANRASAIRAKLDRQHKRRRRVAPLLLAVTAILFTASVVLLTRVRPTSSPPATVPSPSPAATHKVKPKPTPAAKTPLRLPGVPPVQESTRAGVPSRPVPAQRAPALAPKPKPAPIPTQPRTSSVAPTPSPTPAPPPSTDPACVINAAGVCVILS